MQRTGSERRYHRGSHSTERAMSSVSKQDRIVVTLPAPELPKLELERRAFVRLLPQLRGTHFGQYVAVHDGQVVRSGTDRAELATEVRRRLGEVEIYVGLVNDQPQALERSGVVRELRIDPR